MNVRLRQGGYAAYGELKCTHRFLGIGPWLGAVSLMLMFSACIDENSKPRGRRGLGCVRP